MKITPQDSDSTNWFIFTNWWVRWMRNIFREILFKMAGHWREKKHENFQMWQKDAFHNLQGANKRLLSNVFHCNWESKRCLIYCFHIMQMIDEDCGLKYTLLFGPELRKTRNSRPAAESFYGLRISAAKIIGRGSHSKNGTRFVCQRNSWR